MKTKLFKLLGLILCVSLSLFIACNTKGSTTSEKISNESGKESIVDSESLSQTENESIIESESESQTESESVIESESEHQSEGESVIESESEHQSESESVIESVSESQTESESVIESESEHQSESESVIESESEHQSESESVIESESESQAESESMIESESEQQSESQEDSSFESSSESESESLQEPDHFHTRESLEYNDTHHWYECVCGTMDGLEPHYGGTATCEELASCELCGQSYGELAEHIFVDGYCSVCGIKTISQGLEYQLSWKGAFYVVVGMGNCMDVDIVIPSTYKDLPVTAIEARAFYACVNIASVVIPNSVTEIGTQAFAYCTNLVNVRIGDGLSILNNEVFLNCINLKNVTIGKGVTHMYSPFANCFRLENIYYKGDLKGWCNIDTAGCVMKEGSTSKHLYISGELVTEIDIPEGVQRIAYGAFANCIDLTSIVIPNSVTAIGDSAFENCVNLLNLEISKNTESIGSCAFINCNSIKFAQFPANALSEISVERIEEVTILSGDVPSWAFENCDNLLRAYICEGVTSVGGGAFYSCSNLVEVSIPTTVTSIGKAAFSGCQSLTKITIPKGLTTIEEDIFYGCSSMGEVYYQGSQKDWWNIEFKSLGLQVSGLLYIDGDIVTTVVIPEDVTVVDSRFSWFSSITDVIMHDNVIRVEEYAFSDCKNLRSVEFGEGLNSIGQWAFCSSGLQRLMTPNSLIQIDDYAFWDCKDLIRVELGTGVASIGQGAFYGCDNLAIVVNNSSHITVVAGDTTANGYLGTAKMVFNKDEIGAPAITNDNGYVSYVEGEEIVLIDYLGDEIEWVIPDYITKIAPGMAEGNKFVRRITIGDNVTSIGIDAFSRCDNLVQIIYGRNVRSTGGLYDCLSLLEIINNSQYITIEKKDGQDYLPYDGLNVVRSISNRDENYVSRLLNDNGYIVYTDGEEKRLAYYAGEATDIVIPEGVTEIHYHAFINSRITSVTIPQSVKILGNSAFYGCPFLKEVYFNGEISDWLNIWGFENSYLTRHESKYTPRQFFIKGESATEIVIPDNVTEIPEYVFSSFENIERIVLGSSVVSVATCAFPAFISEIDYCGDLEGWLNIEGHDVLMKSEINHLYFNGELVRELIIPDTVTTIKDDAFYGCVDILRVEIGAGVTSIGENAFYKCTTLYEVVNNSTHVTVEIGDDANGYVGYYARLVTNCDETSGGEIIYDNGFIIHCVDEEKEIVKYIGSDSCIEIPQGVTKIYASVFAGNKNIVELVVPDSTTIIGTAAFKGCENLQAVKIGCGLIEIGTEAFANCVNLTSLEIDSQEVLVKAEAFDGCINLASAIVPASVAQTISEHLVRVTITAGDISRYAFSHCYYLEEVVLCDGVTAIGSYAFYRCFSLSSINIPKSLTSIGEYAFNSCVSLTSFVVEENVTSIGASAFAECQNLLTIELGKSLSSIGAAAFIGCGSLKNVYYYGDVQGWCTIEGIMHLMQYGQSKQVYIQGELISKIVILQNVDTIAEYAFYNWDSLISVEILSGVTSIGKYAFYGCDNLIEVTLGEDLISIGESAFASCVNLTSVIIGNDVTTISQYAFRGCKNLTSIEMSSSINNIGKNAFENCSKLTRVNYNGSIDGWYKILFENYAANPINNSKALYVSNVLVEEIVVGAGVQVIKQYAFYGLRSVASVVIANDVATIEKSAFGACNNLTDVFYVGSSEEWDCITIDSSNKMLFSATIYYYVENEEDVPTDGGNYWHYTEDGTIEIWS